MKRSVLKEIRNKREEVTNGAGVGEDCAILSFGKQRIMTAAATVCADWTGAAAQAVCHAANNVAAGGGEPVGITLSLLLPADGEEERLKCLMREAEAVCAKLRMQICGGQTAVSEAVQKPVITAFCVGKQNGEAVSCGDAQKKSAKEAIPAARAGQDVVMTKWAGLEGTAILANQQKEALLKRYPAYLIDEAEAFAQLLSILPEAATAGKSGITAMHDASEGGIFGALWEFGQRSGVGLDIDLKRIPIRQETVEICNYLDVNPYELKAGGSLLLAADRGEELVQILEREGIPAAVIGKTTAGRDRVIRNEEEKRYLEPMRQDQLYRIL